MALPAQYDIWMRELLEDTPPEEPLSDCARCPLVEEQPWGADELRFDRTTKCCTYTPELANFLIGMALSDSSPEASWGRSSIHERIGLGSGVTPLGLRMPALYGLVYERAVSVPPGAFGRSPSLRCPHFQPEGGSCGIWNFRNSVCTTWFCRHERGRVGQEFWMALKRLLKCVEEELAIWAALEMGVSISSIRGTLANAEQGPEQRLAAELVSGPVDVSRKHLWGVWWERESEYFQACAAKVAPLRWVDVLRIGGPRIQAAAVDVVDWFGKIGDPEVVEFVKLGPCRVLGTRDVSTRVQSYSNTDPVDLPVLVFEALLRGAQGSSVADLRKAGASAQMIRRMLEHGLIVPQVGSSIDFTCVGAQVHAEAER